MDSEFKRVLSPSVSLLILAALTPPEHRVDLADENTGPLDMEDRPDLVGITVNVDGSQRAYAIAARYRMKGVPVVLGGIHASSVPDEALMHADSVCVGEAEHLWSTILADAERGRLRRIYRHEGDTDVALTPTPRWDCIRRQDYLYTNILAASRGCPFRCEFCYNSCAYVGRYRPRPIANVLREIDALGTRHVMFIDDNLIGNLAWARELIDGLRARNLTWHAAVSTNLVEHPDLLDRMAASGCQSLFIGFESINRDSIHDVGKRQNHVDAYERLIDAIHTRGIMVNASMVFGFDHDRPDVFRLTLDWLILNRIETMTAHILTPYPGTKLFDRLKAEGRILTFDWTRYNTSHAVFRPGHMTPEELEAGYLWMYKRFYSIPSILRRRPIHPKQRMAFFLFNLGYRKYGKLAARLARLGFMNVLGRIARRLSYGVQ